MSWPKTCRAFRRSGGTYPFTIEPSTETLPTTLAPDDVLIRVHAVSLNFRDIAMLVEGQYPAPYEPGGIPTSDCGAEVVAIGEGVKRFKVGDKVGPNIAQTFLTGEELDEPVHDMVGGDAPGVLSEYGVWKEKGLAKLPEHLSWEEASTIAVAGVTAWNCLNGLKDLNGPRTVLMEGTGGVSMFVLLLSLAAGIKPIITSSSDAKLEQVKKLSPEILGINYKTTNVVDEVLRLTDGKGVDFVINNTGISSFPDNLKCLRSKHGQVNWVGFVGGVEPTWHPNELFALMLKAAKIKGLLGGSRDDFDALNRFLEEKKVSLEPLIDKTFAFEDAPKAFEYLKQAKHVGKVIIKV
ncbi:NAD(P)-binding protein [Lophiostoma macrostomum CBS 122681]|uniref:NAD(P)-binding protein n=1 Tax=Lophiostoma macrostomum CBS 122681 TaxID=1314788 RepID=A0A6A6SSE3_9PLEO|nr:NAD(P)-binding protein [Lophiostoma macrostomum CBS 122681]